MTVLECNAQTFQWNIETSAPRIILAVDTAANESSKNDAIHAKAMEIFLKYQHTKKGSICLVQFSNTTNWVTVKTQANMQQLLEQDFLSSIDNKWTLLFSRIAETYTCYNQPAKVFIISDMQNTKAALAQQFTRLSQRIFGAPLNLHFCQIGTSENGYFPKQPYEIPHTPQVKITYEGVGL